MCREGAWANLGGYKQKLPSLQDFSKYTSNWVIPGMEQKMKYTFDWGKYAELSRKMVAEGCVMLKNDNKALPLRPGDRVSMFGRIMFNYVKSGTGSGGMVNAPYVVSILDAMREEADLTVNEDLIKAYEDWLVDNPFDIGKGWGTEPWSQIEMPVTEAMAKEAATKSDIAVVIIGRSAGEDRDNAALPGAYYLSEGEEQMLDVVCKAFDRVAVILNVGNIIDMKWVEKYKPQAVVYGWQGGCEGGNGVMDVLTGKVNPCGKLADTIAYEISDYPSDKNFGDKDRNFYEEDIYVGYRYFETAAKDKVMYPFGFGMSYSTFDLSSTFSIIDDKTIRISTNVTNTGDMAGKEVVQVYFEAPQGALSKPARQLIGFAKTDTIFAGISQSVDIDFTIDKMASFDDSGATGHKDCYVLEAGEYIIYAGSDVRSAEMVGSFTLGQTIVTEALSENCTPTEPMKRMVFKKQADGSYVEEMEDVPTRTYDLYQRIKDRRPADRPCTGDKGYKFADVMKGQVSIEDYLDQLTDTELIYITRGEGMCSPKVTPGVAAAFGGCAEVLNKKYGMPIAACSDGPSGIRMDCGAMAYSLPNGAAQACSFNLPLIEELYEYEGMELRKNKIDSLLGPGINIHRHPLNGRNFEYYSEDPLLTGACAAAELKGLHKWNVTGTCKHFSTNNQETRRHFVDAHLSARALREIYLKPFEIAVKEGGAYCIMTTYGPLNGIYTASNYDLNTSILRGEWGYDGLTMTDWWAKMSWDDGSEANIQNTTNMVRAQNDIYMVTSGAAENGNNDNSEEGLAKGRISRGELLRNAANVCSVLKRSLAGIRLVEGEDEIEFLNPPKGGEKIQNAMPYMEITAAGASVDLTGFKTEAGCENVFTMHVLDSGVYNYVFRIKSDAGELSQSTMTVSQNGMIRAAFTINGTNGEWIEKNVEIDCSYQRDNYVSVYFAQTGIDVDSIEIRLVKSLTMGDKRALDALV